MDCRVITNYMLMPTHHQTKIRVHIIGTLVKFKNKMNSQLNRPELFYCAQKPLLLCSRYQIKN